jgi:hypothetical protein
MYALGEIIERVSASPLLDTYLYINKKGIRQRLPDDHVELISDSSLDTEQEAL